MKFLAPMPKGEVWALTQQAVMPKQTIKVVMATVIRQG